MKKFFNKKVIFIGIIIMGIVFRLYGINWDQNQHLHPDERFLTMVSTSIQWPASINEYFNTNISPLNPHNKEFPFFVYGTFPIFLTKFIAELFNLGDYSNLTLVGRILSGFIDVGTVVLVFFIAKELTKNSRNIALLAMAIYASLVLPIQLAHFYAVDTYLTFFITLSFYALIKIIFSKSIHISQFVFFIFLLGLSFGLALASKISALFFLPIIELGFIILLSKSKNIKHFLILNSLFFIFAYFTIRLFQPYLFYSPNLLDITPNPKVLENWKTLETFNNPSGWFPPGVQWITTKAYFFPLKNLIFWGMGLPLGAIALLGVFYQASNIIYIALKRKLYLLNNTHSIILTLSLFWIIILFTYQGYQFAKPMRYFYPIYPFLAIISAWFLDILVNKLKIAKIGYVLFGLIILIYPISFITIYARPHSRIQASQWIFNNIPPGSSIASEYWDDPLPLHLTAENPGKYNGIMLPLYDTDSEEKWQKLSNEIREVDYIILSSNRLYGSILTVPEKYPLTKKYYESLFDGSLGFEKIAEFTSRPNLPIPAIKICLTPPFIRYGIIALKNQECALSGISFVDDYSDESFTVYDHPKIIIFKKKTN